MQHLGLQDSGRRGLGCRVVDEYVMIRGGLGPRSLEFWVRV